MAAALDTYLKWPVRKRVLLWVGVCAVVGGLYTVLGFQPTLQTLRDLQAEQEGLARDLRENQAIADNLAQVKEEVRLLDERLSRALEKLPNREEIPTLLQTVSDLGRDSGLEFLLFKPGAPQPQQFYAEVPLELQIAGRYHDLAAFFDKVGRLPRIVTIQDVDFGSPKPGPGGIKLTAACRAATFKFLETGEQPRAAGQGQKGGQ